MIQLDSLITQARKLVQEYQASNLASQPELPTPTKRAVIDFYEAQHGPLVVLPDRYEQHQAYLIPLNEKDDSTFLNTKTPPGRDTLTPYRINPVLLPTAAKLQALLYNISDESPDTSVGTAPPSDKHTEEPSSDVPAIVSEPQVFSFVFESAPAPEAGHSKIDDEHEKNDDSLDLEEEKEATTRKVSLRSKNDLKRFVASCAGLPIVPEEADKIEHAELDEKPNFHTIGYTDLQRKRINVPTLEVASDAIRKIVKQPALSSTSLDDRKEKAKSEKLRGHNELDKWFGMKRQKITPEIRAELKAIDLRGFTDPKRRYRGTKRQMALSKAESGFFQMGVVLNGGIEDSGVSADTSAAKPDSNRKRTKTLVKSILKASGI